MNIEKLIKMKPALIFNYTQTFVSEKMYELLLNKEEVPWVNVDAPRDECFMSKEPLEYAYGSGGHTRSYKSVPMHAMVEKIMLRLNEQFDTNYNVCFLNYYKSDKEHLGWHADDSPEMNPEHPIAVISFGAVREIWVKDKNYKGTIPEEDKYGLGNGSLFIMPKGFQANNLHKIPKHDKPCGGRISLTFRNYLNPAIEKSSTSDK